jgi:hypothetical protein
VKILDMVLPIVGLLVWLAIIAAVVIASYRRLRPYRLVGRNYGTGMVGVRWRDDPERTYWLTPDHLTQQKGLHR